MRSRNLDRGAISMRRGRAFTLIELLVVIVLITLLASFLITILVRARAEGRCVTCMSNVRNLTVAYLAYCDANDGCLFPVDNPFAQGGEPPDFETADIPELTAYSGDPRIFHCIEDLRVGCRSYSINDYMGGTFPFIGLQHARYLRRVQNMAHTFLFIEETPPKTRNGFIGGFVVLPYPSDHWVDAPAVPHPRGTCLSFVDGHAEFWQWIDSRTRTLPITPFPKTTDNLDLVHLQGVLGQPGAPIQ